MGRRLLASLSRALSFRRQPQQLPDCDKKQQKKKKEEEEEEEQQQQQQLDVRAASISSSSGRLLLPPPPRDSMAEFEGRLSGRLRHLSLGGGGGGALPQQQPQLNLAWLSDALAIAVSTQSSLLHALHHPPRTSTALIASSRPTPPCPPPLPSPAAAAPGRAHPPRRRLRRRRRRRLSVIEIQERSPLELRIDGLVCLIDHANALRRATLQMAEHLGSLDRSLAAVAKLATLALNSSAAASSSSCSPLAASSLRLLSSVSALRLPTSADDRALYSQACRHMKKRLRLLSTPAAAHHAPTCHSPSSSAASDYHHPSAAHQPPIVARALLGLTLTTNLILCTLLSSFLSPPGMKRTTTCAAEKSWKTTTTTTTPPHTKGIGYHKRHTSAPSSPAPPTSAVARLCRSAGNYIGLTSASGRRRAAPSGRAHRRRDAEASVICSSSRAGSSCSAAQDAPEQAASWAAPFRQLQGQLLRSSRSRGEVGLAGEGLLTKEVMMIQAAAGALALRLAAAISATITSSSTSRSSRSSGGGGGGGDGAGADHQKAAGGRLNLFLQDRQRRLGLGAAAAAAAALGKAARELRGGVLALHQQACSLAMALAELRVALLDAFCTSCK